MKKIFQKVTLGIGIASFAITLITMEELGFCRLFLKNGCILPASDPTENLLFLFTISILPFTLITFWMKEEVFKSWFKFAAWSVPLIMITNIYLEATKTIGGFFNMDNAFNFLVMLVLYSLFALISIVLIVRKYLKTKTN